MWIETTDNTKSNITDGWICRHDVFVIGFVFQSASTKAKDVTMNMVKVQYEGGFLTSTKGIFKSGSELLLISYNIIQRFSDQRWTMTKIIGFSQKVVEDARGLRLNPGLSLPQGRTDGQRPTNQCGCSGDGDMKIGTELIKIHSKCCWIMNGSYSS